MREIHGLGVKKTHRKACPVSKLGSFCQTTPERRRGTALISKQFNFLRKKTKTPLLCVGLLFLHCIFNAVFFNFEQRVLFPPCRGPILSSYTEGKDF